MEFERIALRISTGITAILILMGSLMAPATAQEVPNGSSAPLGSLSTNPLDARATGNSVPPKQEMDRAFGCHSPQADQNAKKTVLLVHGVGGNAQMYFSWNYIPQLTAERFDVCWVDLPHSGRGDLTEAAQYVMNAVKLAHGRLDKNISIVGHSAGPPASMWALRYDEEAAKMVDDFVAVAGAIHGTTLVEPVCKGIGNCPVLAWQMHPKSNFVQALNAKPLPEGIDVTSVYSKSDYGIQPAEQVSSIAGGQNIAVQDVCPAHLPGHLGILQNNTAYRLILDALNNDGPADPARLGNFDCKPFFAPGLDVTQAHKLIPVLGEYPAAFGEPRYTSEPPLPTYAQDDVTDPVDPDQIAAGSSERIGDSLETFGDAVLGSASGSN